MHSIPNSPSISHSRLRMMIVALLAGISILFAAEANAATFYVATNGSDSNSGSETQPFRNIKKGMSVLKAGDTLYVKQGTYAEKIDSNAMTIPAGSSWDNPVTVAAYPGHTVTLQPSSGSAVVNLASAHIQFLIFDGFIIDARYSTSFGVSGWGGAKRVRFSNGEIKNAPMSGVLLTYGNGFSTDYFEFLNMKVHSNGKSKLDHGLYIATSYNLVADCEIYNNSGLGVHIYNGSSGQVANNNLIDRNTVRNNGWSDQSSGGIILSSGSGNVARNNVVFGNPHGILVYNNTSKSLVHNNTVYDNKYYGIHVSSGSSEASLKNNILYKNGSGAIYNQGSGTVASSNLTTDPLFTDPTTFDFSLKSGSPAIDAGAALADVKNDFRKTARPQGASHDIGAFEFTTTSTTSAPTNLRIVSK